MKKCFIDSNIIIRLVIKDPTDQFIKSKEILKEIEDGKTQGIISVLVVNEIIWILEHYYDLKRDKYIPILLQLLALKNIKIHEVKKDIIIEILQRMLLKKIDLTDMYLKEIANKNQM